MLITAGAILGAMVGYALALGLAFAVLAALGVSEAQGQRATLAGLFIAPMGALAGAVSGGWAAWHFARDGSAAWLPGALATLAVLGLAGLSGLAWLRNRRPLSPNRAPLRLMFELRRPAGAPAFQVTLNTDRNTMPADLDPPRPDHDARLQSGAVDLYFRTRNRHLDLTSDGSGPIRFALPLPAAPQPGAWSDWRDLGSGISLRWRVQD